MHYRSTIQSYTPNQDVDNAADQAAKKAAARAQVERERAEFSDLTDEQIDQRAASGQARLAELSAAAERCAAEADQQEAHFRREPSAEALTAAAVVRQLASNAREAVDKHAREIEPLLREVERRASTRRLHELREQLDWAATMSATSERVRDAYREFIAVVRSELAALARSMQAHNEVVGEASSLERAFGDGRDHQRLRFDRVYAEVNQVLQQLGPNCDLWQAGTGDNSRYVARARVDIDLTDHVTHTLR